MPRMVRPDPHRRRGVETGSPVESVTRRSIKRNKELFRYSKRFPECRNQNYDAVSRPNQVALDEWDGGFRQTTSKTPVPTHYDSSYDLRFLFCRDPQERLLASYRLS